MYRPGRNPRIPKTFATTVEFVGPGGGLKLQRHKGPTKDISRAGLCCVLLAIELPAKSRVTVTVDIPGPETGAVAPYQFKSPGVVRWTKKMGEEEKFLTGIEFVEMSRHQVESWGDIVRRWTSSEV